MEAGGPDPSEADLRLAASDAMSPPYYELSRNTIDTDFDLYERNPKAFALLSD